MNGKPFFDINVIIYTVAEVDARADIARSLLRAGGVISVQVLNEFVAAARRKLRMSWEEVHEALSNFRALCDEPLPMTVGTHEAALQIAQRHGYRVYDSLIIAAALAARSTTLYSEDMRDGQQIEKLIIRNPFVAMK